MVTKSSPVEWGETVVLYGIGFGAFNDTSGTLATGFPADGHPAPTDRLVHLFTEFTDVMQVTSLCVVPVDNVLGRPARDCGATSPTVERDK